MRYAIKTQKLEMSDTAGSEKCYKQESKRKRK